MAASVFKTLQVVLTANVSSFQGQMRAAAAGVSFVNKSLHDLQVEAARAAKASEGVAQSLRTEARAATEAAVAQRALGTELQSLYNRNLGGTRASTQALSDDTAAVYRNGFARSSAGAAGTAALQKQTSAMYQLGAESAATTGVLGATVLAVAAVGIGAAYAFAKGEQAAIAFDEQIRDTNSILISAGDSTEKTEAQFRSLSQSVLSLTGTATQGPTELAQGLYGIAQAGFVGADAMKLLQPSAKAATAGLVDVNTAADVLTSVLHAYGLQVGDATHVTDVLFQAVVAGKVSFQELAHGLGDVTAIAAAAHIPLEDVTAAVASMTQTGVPAAEAFVRTRRVIQELIKPTENLSRLYEEMGVHSGEEALKKFNGLSGVLDEIRKRTGGSAAAYQALFADIRAQGGALSLAANDGKVYADVLGQINNASAGQGATQQAFTEQMKAVSNQMKLAKATVEGLAVELLHGLQPGIAAGIGGFVNLVQQIERIVRSSPELRSSFAYLKSVLTDMGPSLREIAHYGAAFIEVFVKGAVKTIAADMKLLADTLQVVSFIMKAIPNSVPEPFRNAAKSALGLKDQADSATDSLNTTGQAGAAAGSQAASGITNATDALDGMTQAQQRLVESQREWLQVLQSWNSPSTALSNAQQEIQQRAADASEGATKKINNDYKAQEKAVTDRYKKEREDLQAHKSDIQNHSQGYASAIQDEIQALNEKEQAEKDALQANKARAAEDQQSREQSAGKAKVGLAQFLAQIQGQTKSTKAWMDNIHAIAKKAGLDAPDVIDFLKDLGPESATAIDQLAHSNQTEFDKALGTIKESIKAQGEANADEMSTQMGVLRERGRQGAQATADSIGQALGIGADKVAQIASAYGFALSQAAIPILNATGQTISNPYPGYNGPVFIRPLPGGGTTVAPSFAEGGFSEDHSAQIAQGATPFRVWAEPETGGEAYIPLSPQKRARSVGILSQVAGMFDLELSGKSGGYAKHFADGGFEMGAYSLPKPPKLRDVLLDQMASNVMNIMYDAVLEKAQQQSVSAQISGTSSGGAPSGAAPAGNVTDWIHQAEAIAGWPDTYTAGLYKLIMHESGGNPRAINLWDSNAKAGHPSKGLMQTIDGTFNAHAFAGHGDIWNPVDNILAGTSYALKRYGEQMVINGGRRNAAGKYIGYAEGGINYGTYDSGGPLMPGWTMAYNGTGRAETILTGDQVDRLVSAMERGSGGPSVIVQGDSQSVMEVSREVVRKLR